ncbi:MAG: hypothetical protein EDM75_11540 [Chlorobiota bacterium]|nr:MAG: hypothetical protein EDM75_11540 [Chlorobiota bacterium]
MDNPDPVSTHHFDDIENKLDLIRGMIDLKHSRGVILRELNSLLSLLHSKFQPLYNEAIFTEFYPVYLKLLGSFRVFGAPPSYAKSIIQNAGKLYRINSGAFRQPEMALELKRISSEFRSLKRILRGGTAGSGTGRKGPVFPVIESGDNTAGITYLDSLDVKVTPASGSTRFIIHPTYKEEEPVLLQQVMDSFSVALSMIPAGTKKLPAAFEVQVYFRSRLGIYSGNSFGVLLALLIKIEINKLLQPNIVYEISPATAFTGAVSPSGEVKPVGREIIARKVRSVFFSDVTNFIIPKEDEPAARATLAKLQEKWPNRSLDLTVVNSVSDILNRRDIVQISKRPIKERVKATARKHKYTSLVLIPVLVLLGFLYAREFDTNPVSFDLDGTNLMIKNKFGSVLWSNTVHPNVEKEMTEDGLKIKVRIIDIDNDGVNEVLYTSDLIELHKSLYFSSIRCFDGRKREIWQFTFQDTVSSPKENNIPGDYNLHMMDTISLGGRKLLMVVANSAPTFPAALFYIDPKTGKKVGGAIWNAGFIDQVAIADINGDGFRDRIFSINDNADLIIKIVAVPMDFAEGMIKTRSDYMLYGKTPVHLLLEIKLPATDYMQKIEGANRDRFPPSSIQCDDEGKISFMARYSARKKENMYLLSLDSKTHELSYFIWGGYRIIRDSLVNAGKLPLPYTDTKEYTDNLKNQVRYKLDGKWVTYAEYKKSRGKD